MKKHLLLSLVLVSSAFAGVSKKTVQSASAAYHASPSKFVSVVASAVKATAKVVSYPVRHPKSTAKGVRKAL